MAEKKKNYVVVSGFDIHDVNRGSAALGYGSIAFLHDLGLLNQGQKILTFHSYKKFWKAKNKKIGQEKIMANGLVWDHCILGVFFLEIILLRKFGLRLPFTRFGKIIKQIDFVAAINGGDGFSDIYGTPIFLGRLSESLIAMKMGFKLYILPQTLGPFNSQRNYLLAMKILSYASQVYVRDDRFVGELEKNKIPYELTRDLSFFMKPEEWNIEIFENAVGINISGLAYSNKFKSLTGHFDCYPELVDRLIERFQQEGKNIYLIPHSYGFNRPDKDNDDIVALEAAYKRLKNTENVIKVVQNLTPPQVKYVISKMKFFIGTRMHANFAAIYTGVPLFGLAYSYKFEGAFNANGLDGSMQTTSIVDIKPEEIDGIVEKIMHIYKKSK